MHIEIKGVHYEISEATEDFFTKKLKRLEFAGDLIVDLLITIKRETRDFKIEANINFRWGATAHIHVDCFELYKGIELIVDKLQQKISKEKEKIQQH